MIEVVNLGMSHSRGHLGTRDPLGFTASPRRYLRTVLREMPSSRAIARIPKPRRDNIRISMIPSSASIGPPHQPVGPS